MPHYEVMTSKNTKIMKNMAQGFYTVILHLAPHMRSGINVCPYASPGCIAGCLNTAGHGRYNNVQEARIRRSMKFHTDRPAFLRAVHSDLLRAHTHARRNGVKLAVRMNGTSDILWERIPVEIGPQYAESIMHLWRRFPDVQFYDYTKIPIGMRMKRIPDNYHITFSLSESNEAYARGALDLGFNVAVVFRGETLPETFWGRRVVNGDLHDCRFTADKGVIIGLHAKGAAKHDTSGFVREAYDPDRPVVGLSLALNAGMLSADK